MAEWVNGKVTQVKQWTNGLFSLGGQCPIDPFTAGEFTKLALEIDGERCNAPTPKSMPPTPTWSSDLVTVPEGNLSRASISSGRGRM